MSLASKTIPQPSLNVVSVVMIGEKIKEWKRIKKKYLN